MFRIIHTLFFLALWVSLFSTTHATLLSGTYFLPSSLLRHHEFDTRIPLTMYHNLQNIRANVQLYTAKKIDLEKTSHRYMYYFGNLIVDNTLLETLFIGSFHEPRHAEIAQHYGAEDIRVDHFSMSYSGFELTPAQHAHINGAGINLQTTIASQDYINHLLLNKTSHLTRSTYISNKMTGFVYVACLNFGDPIYYRGYLEEQGISITKAELGAYYTLSTFLSGGTLNYLYNAYSFLTEGTFSTPRLGMSFRNGKLYWPELSVYMNPNNVSLLTEFVYLSTNTESYGLMWGIETLIKGTPFPEEYKCGVIRSQPHYQIRSSLTFNLYGNYFLESSLRRNLSQKWSLQLSYRTGDRYTQKQQRDWPFSKDILEASVLLTL